jgi:hypothetical protein
MTRRRKLSIGIVCLTMAALVSAGAAGVAKVRRAAHEMADT